MFYKANFTLLDKTNIECIINDKTFTYLKKVLWKKTDISIFKTFGGNKIKNFFNFFFKFIMRYKFKSNSRYFCDFFIIFPQNKNNKEKNYLFKYKDINELIDLEKTNQKKEILINLNTIAIFSYEKIDK